MSLADAAKAHVDDRELHTLVIDVERLPGTAAVPFWGLSDYKNRRIHHTYVTEWPRVILGCWRWVGQKTIHTAAEWDKGGPAGMAARIGEALDKADIITGHNVNKADRRWINTLLRDHQIPWPSPYKVIDTLTVARRDLGDESLTLDALCTRYGIPTKTDVYDADRARAACEGNRAAQREITAYCKGDVEASTGLYFATLPLAHSHPHVAPAKAAQKTSTCPRCASPNTKRNGTYTPGVYIYARWQCLDCQGFFRTTYEHRGPSVRTL